MLQFTIIIMLMLFVEGYLYIS